VTTSDLTARDPQSSLPRPSRRRLLPLLGAAAAVAAAVPALASAQGSATELQASQSGQLPGGPSGGFVNYQISHPSGGAVTLTMTYGPFNIVYAHAIGFNVWQNGSKIASASGQSVGAGDKTSGPTATATFTPSASGGAVAIQLFNYSQSAVNYGLMMTQGASSGGSAAAPAPASPATLPPSTASARYVYVGSYTAPSHGQGIYVFRMDPGTGSLTQVQVVTAENPSFVVVDPTNHYLYSTNELGVINKQPGGRFSAYRIDPGTGKLTFLNTVLSQGTYPAHLSVHPHGGYLLGSNYGTGNFPIYRIMANGSIGPMTDNAQDTGVGTGPNSNRQEGPHAHQIVSDPGANHVFGVDLGADKVMVWNLNLTTGKLSPGTVPYAQVASGSGCRHIAFHPNHKFAYVIDEMVSSITAFAYDETRGAFIWLQTVSTLPSSFTGTSSCAEVRVHPTGKWVYGTNRGHDSVAIFAVGPDGRLTSTGWVSSQGKTPRGMNIDPSGTFLYTGNQDSDTIGVFRIDPSNGNLVVSTTISTGTPVDIEFGGPA
jgi:6-phosphogluconolactonase